jgi:hypothetical protein
MPTGTFEELERKAREQEEVHPLDWQDDFGPLRYTQLTEFVQHLQAIEHEQDRQAQQALCARFGYRDFFHFRRVRATFLKYYGDPNDGVELATFAWKEPEFSQALLGAMALDRAAAGEDALRKNPALTAPEEGVSLEQYGALCAQVGARQPAAAELARMLAAMGLDIEKWQRVNAAWQRRMQDDESRTIIDLFTRAYTAAGAGQFGAAAQAAGAAGYGMSGQAPGGPEPMPLVKYVEIGAAMAAWARQGKDVNAMLAQTYRMTAGDLSAVNLYWHARMNADLRLYGEYNRLQEEYARRFAQPDPDADLKF